VKYNKERSKPVSFKAYNNADELEKLAKLKNSGMIIGEGFTKLKTECLICNQKTSRIDYF
jgi:hypothetical protein